MALTKPPVFPAWAESGDKVQPTNAEIQVGWPLSNVPPARQRWNWLLNFLANGVRYFSRRGMPDYDAAETYMIGDRIIGDDGKTYKSLQDTNLAHTPSTSPTWWERWGYGASELGAELNKLDQKASCRVASTANIAALTGLLTIDGVVLVAGDRVLVKDQTTPSQNGIYVAAVGAWSRATDADDGTKLTSGATVPIEAGTTQADGMWMMTTDGTITVGSTPLTFVFVAGNTGFAKTNAANTFTKGQVGNELALPATTGTVTLDLSQSNNWGGTLTGSITLANPSSMPIGQSGVVRIVNGATPYTIAFGSYWKASSGALPSLTATAGATDDLVYYVESATRIVVSALGDTK